MEKKQPRWQIWIDTGGTFTDCLAHDPFGKLIRIKVLSSSALRGKIARPIDEISCEISANWPVSRDIFAGYQFFLPDQKQPIKVKAYDPSNRILHLSQPPEIPLAAGLDFEISAGEEAPVLASRLATQTALHEPLPPLDMRLGSTRATNALLERKGAKTVLLVSRGFKDLLLIDTQQRPDIFSLKIERPAPYYAQVIEVNERIDAQGKVLLPLSPEEMERIRCEIEKTDAESVAIALMHSYLNPAHEKQLEEYLRTSGHRYISGSSALAPAIRILSRAKTALVNAYLSPVIDDYLSSVKSKITAGSLKVMTSAGGLVDASQYHPKDSLLSGPAGGVAGSASISRLARRLHPGLGKILALDMGGTSTDVSRYDGEFDYRYETQVGDISLFSPALAIETVAAGGGSCCTFDGHKLSVGPESAGAYPGPACYGFGGPLTLTDVNLLLGRLTPDRFGIPLSLSKAELALQQLKNKMEASGNRQYSDKEILQGLLSIANEKMTDAIRKISVRKGYDPRDYALLAFGGAGGQHACQVADMLGCQYVIVPYDAGLLSAYGMGQALVERFASRQLLQILEEAENVLPTLVQELQEKALHQLREEGFADNELQIRFVRIYLRFRGQESSLELDYTPGMPLSAAFQEKYEALFGHWLPKQLIEVESVKVIASTYAREVEEADQPETYPAVSGESQNCLVGNEWQQVAVYVWEELKPGAFLEGPGLLVSDNCTTLVEKGWELQLDAYRTALLTRTQVTQEQADIERPEEVQLELFTNRFTAIVEEMGALLERTSFSVNVKERLDFSCALLDEQGELIVNAPHIPVHLGSMGICVRSVMAHLPMEEGDVIVTNHPAFGGSHLPDITLICPVFYEGKCIGYVANRAHHAEIGGKRPGSMPTDATSLQEEGVVIHPTYLLRKGKACWDEIRKLLSEAPYPSRSLDENMADLNGALASVLAGAEALQRLCRTYYPATIAHYMRALKAYAAACLENALTQIDAGSYAAYEQLDDGTPIGVQLSLYQKEASLHRLKIRWEGSGAVHPANLNATPAIVNSAVIYVLRLLIRQPIPLNEGIMQLVDLQLPENSFLNPPFPDEPAACPAVVGGNTESSQRLVDTLLKALDMAACSQGTMNNLLFGNENFGYYETIGGGSGAGPGFKGADAVHQHMTNTRITDPEVLEFRYPVRLEEFGIRRGSGGPGRWKGGDGIIRRLTFLEAVSVTILSQHRTVRPYGIRGGQEGQPGRQYIIRSDGTMQELKGIDQAELLPGDSMVVETPGGGGCGSPD
ncbi:MAG: hydantoinase B/oxoprolinase family protein [Cyclobacteriaceae bacterium]